MTSVLHDAGIAVDRGYLVDRRHRARPTGGDGGRRGAPTAQVNFGSPTAISTSVSNGVRSNGVRHLDGQNSVVLEPSRLEQQPDEYANHSMKEKEQ